MRWWVRPCLGEARPETSMLKIDHLKSGGRLSGPTMTCTSTETTGDTMGRRDALLDPSLLVFRHPLGARSYGLIGCNLRPPPPRLRYVGVHPGVAPIRHAARRALTAGRRHDQDAILRSAHPYVFASPPAETRDDDAPYDVFHRVSVPSLPRSTLTVIIPTLPLVRWQEGKYV